MRILVLLICILFFSACSSENKKEDATIKFLKYEHDFGKLELNQEASYSFEFSNPGKSPLIVFNVKTSCGCTAAGWPRKPVLPDKSGKIEINYDSKTPGTFYKSLTVYFNGKQSPLMLKIKGQVKYPVNAVSHKK